MRELQIVIPMMPPSECSPNSRVNWRRKAAAARDFRQAAGWAVVGHYDFPWAMTDGARYVMDVEIAWGGNRQRMDDDNAWASLKAMRDGIADVLFAGEDKYIRQGELRQTRGNGTTTVTLREAADS